MHTKDELALLEAGDASSVNGRALQAAEEQEDGVLSSDLKHLRCRRLRYVTACLSVASCLGVSVLLVVLESVLLRQSATDSTPELHEECLYPVGGGLSGATGGFPQDRIHKGDYCKDTFEIYFQKDGQYFTDLEEAGAAALAYYTANGTTWNSSQLLVFDIDETSLSNLEHEARTEWGSAEEVEPWDLWVALAAAPAIVPVLNVYRAAYSRGMSVTFLTGRSDTESGRAATADNLAKAGYGSQCSRDSLGQVARSEEPCYVRLDMRDLSEDMSKPASVYKPERRQRLIDEGFSLAGSFGDQFSDLDGASQADASWKLPNPMYYIL